MKQLGVCVCGLQCSCLQGGTHRRTLTHWAVKIKLINVLKPVHRMSQVSLSSTLPEKPVRSHLPGLALPVPIVNTVCTLGSPPEQIFSLLRLPVSLKKTSALPCLFIPSPVASFCRTGQDRAGQGTGPLGLYSVLPWYCHHHRNVPGFSA